MTRTLGVVILLAAAGGLVADDPKPSLLDKVQPANLPVAIRPLKGMPKDVVAALGQRGDKVDCFAIRGDGRFLAISGADQYVRVWDLDGIKPVAATRQPDGVVCLAFSPNYKLLAAGDASGGVRVYEKADTRTPTLKHTLAAHKDGPVWSVVFSPDSKTLATAGRDRVIGLWDMTKAKPTMTPLTGHEDGVRGVAFDSTGKWLFSTGGEDGQLRTWDVSGGKPKAGEATKVGGRVTGVAVSADGSTAVTAGLKGAARVWAVKDGRPDNPVPLEADGKSVFTVGFAPDGKSIVGVVALSDTEDQLIVWGLDGKKKHTFRYDLHLHSAGFAPDGRHVIVVTEERTLVVRLPK